MKVLGVFNFKYMNIQIPVSLGELFDKITILQIKVQKITDPEKVLHIVKEYEILINISRLYFDIVSKGGLIDDLMIVNNELWEVEDNIRMWENKKKFGDAFIELARKVYILNDRRANIKAKINVLTDSDIIEVKEYTKYK